MFGNVAARITKRLLRSEVILEEEQEIYEFGVTQGCIILCNLLTMIVLALCFDALAQAVIILLAFMQLRSYAGGIHAKTAGSCYVLTSVAMAMLLWIQKVIVIDTGTLFALLGVSGCVIVLLSPVESLVHPLDALERSIYRSRAIKVWFAECMIATVCIWTPLKTVAICIMLAHVLLAFSMFCGWISNENAKRKTVQWE